VRLSSSSRYTEYGSVAGRRSVGGRLDQLSRRSRDFPGDFASLDELNGPDARVPEVLERPRRLWTGVAATRLRALIAADVTEEAASLSVRRLLGELLEFGPSRLVLRRGELRGTLSGRSR
jgi:hypothetical protein